MLTVPLYDRINRVLRGAVLELWGIFLDVLVKEGLFLDELVV